MSLINGTSCQPSCNESLHPVDGGVRDITCCKITYHTGFCFYCSITYLLEVVGVILFCAMNENISLFPSPAALDKHRFKPETVNMISRLVKDVNVTLMWT